MRMQVPSLASLSGLRIRHCHELWCREVWQWTPLTMLTLSALTTVWVWRRPGPGVLRVYRGVMVVCVVAAVAGMVFHYNANATLELELDPTVGGVDLFWKAMRGGVPSLAPGALLQVGLIGLIASWRHPALIDIHIKPEGEGR